MLYTNTRKK